MLETTGVVTRHQRSQGELLLSFKLREGRTVLDGLRQEGCLKARFPRADPAEWTGAVTLNSSGGVAGGDRLILSIGAGEGTRATVASQAAERFYRALPGTHGAVTTTIDVAAGAALEWLPQEAILFDGCALRRELHIELAADARFLGVETLLFGRAAMGETVRTGAIDDLLSVRRDGRLLLHDRIRLHGEVATLLQRRAIGAGACGIATIVAVSPDVEAGDVEAGLEKLRAALAPFEAGASAERGMLLARIVAGNGACLRAAVVAGLNVLRGGRPLPRVWSC